MADYGVDPKNLIDTGGELRQATTAIARALDDLDAAVSTYRASNQGETADAFGRAQATWKTGVLEMNTSLDNAALALDDIAYEYHRTDAAGAASF